MAPPGGELGATFERWFSAEHAQQVYGEERGRRQRAVCQGKVGAGGKSAIGQHLLELVEASVELGELVVDDLLVAGLGIHVRKQGAQRRFKVQIVKTGERTRPRPGFGRLWQ